MAKPIPFVVNQADITPFGTDNTFGHRGADSERIPNSEDNVTNFCFIAVSNGDCWQILRVNLQQGHIGFWVGSDQGRFMLFFVLRQRNLNLISGINDMVISQDITVLTDDDT